MNSGNQENSTLLLGVKEKMQFWQVSAFNKLPKGWNKIKWHSVQLMLKDMSFPSKRELNNWSEDFQTLHKLLIFGLKFKNFGPVWSLSSLEVILPNKCHFKPNNFLVLIRLGWNVCKNHLKLKRFSNPVNSIYLRIIYLICRKNYKNAKNYSKPISKEKENYSQDFISFQIQHY